MGFMGKTILPSKFTEWQGLDAIQSTVHEMKCIFREITKDDFGIDGEIEMTVPKPGGQGYETAGGIIKVQAKSGASYVKQNSETSFTTPIGNSDLQSWHNSNFPVLFIVYNPHDEKLYWRHIQSYLKEDPTAFQPPLKIEFRKPQDEFHTGSYHELCKLAAVSPPRVDQNTRERLFSNRLFVKMQPQIMTFAPSGFESTSKVRAELKPGFVPPFCLRGKHLFTLSDLRNRRCILRKCCDSTKIRDMTPREWINDTSLRNDYVFLLNQLLGIHLYRCGLKYNHRLKVNYFPRDNSTDTEFKRKWYNVRTERHSSRTVVKYYEYGPNRFWRHQAVSLRFRFMNKSLGLEVVPRYLFTTDGQTLWDSEKIGPYTTRIKAQERNLNFLTNVLFWSDILSQGQQEITIQLDGRTAMCIEKLPMHGFAEFAIVTDPAHYEEPDDTGQLELFELEPTESGEDDDEFLY